MRVENVSDDSHCRGMTKRASPLKILSIAKAVYAYSKIVRDPNRLEEVFHLADSLSEPKVMERIAAGFRKHPGGVAALAARKRVRVDLAALERLDEGTLG